MCPSARSKGHGRERVHPHFSYLVKRKQEIYPRSVQLNKALIAKSMSTGDKNAKFLPMKYTCCCHACLKLMQKVISRVVEDTKKLHQTTTAFLRLSVRVITKCQISTAS
jgi:hypothetical protein